MQRNREKALEAGMDDYISKPVKSEELSQILERWIQPTNTGAGALQESATASGSDSTFPDTKAEELLDHSIIEGLRELKDPEVLTELVELFVSEAPLRFAALHEAVERVDAGTLSESPIRSRGVAAAWAPGG
jgi:two-component system, sensor histidine kinase and response regulator